MDANDVETQMRDTFAQLTVWGDRVRDGFAPEPCSPLSDDDAVFPWLATSDIAWQALAAAQDHLKSFRAWLLANDSMDPDARPGLFPIATFGLLRGALVGGAIASWVLTSDDVDVRTGRSLAVAAYWYENHLRWGRGMTNYAADRAGHESQLRHVEGRAKKVAELRKSREPKGTLKTTTAIVQANDEIWPDDQARAAATLALWQSGSGDAHALGWSILTRGYDMTPLGEGTGHFVAKPSMRDVGDAYLCAYDFVAFGFHRLDELGTA